MSGGLLVVKRNVEGGLGRPVPSFSLFSPAVNIPPFTYALCFTHIVIGVTLNLIGLEDGVGVLNQSQSEVKQTKKKS